MMTQKSMVYSAVLLGILSWGQNLWGATLESQEKQQKALALHDQTIRQAFAQGMDHKLTPSDTIQMVAGGFSKADLFRVQTAQGTYIVKIMKDSPVEDVQTEITAAGIASDAGVGPKLFYSNLATKTLIMDYIQDTHEMVRQSEGFHRLVAPQIKSWHDAKPLNRSTPFFDILRQDEQRLVTLKQQSTMIRAADRQLYHQRLQEVEEVLKHFQEDTRPVHHDLSPHNVLFDGSKVWLIDWETASNDFYFIDLCMFANFHIYDESLMPKFFETYYGRPATDIEVAKFHVIRPFCYAFHGFRLAFLADQKKMPQLGSIMEYKDFQLAIRRGEFALGSPLSLFQLGVSTMNKAASMLRGEDFKRSLALLKRVVEDQQKTDRKEVGDA